MSCGHSADRQPRAGRRDTREACPRTGPGGPRPHGDPRCGYRHADITKDDLLAEFTSWGLSRAAATIADTLEQLEEAVKEEAPLDGAFPALQEQILGFIETLRVGAV